MKPELAKKAQEIMNARDQIDRLQAFLARAISPENIEEAVWLPPGGELNVVMDYLQAPEAAVKVDFTRIRTKLRDTLVQELRKTDRYLQDKLNSL